MSIEIRVASPEQTGQVRTVLARGLAEDPLFRWFFPEPETRLARVATYLAPQVEWLVASGTTHVALDGDRVVGAAVWREADAVRPEVVPTTGDVWPLLVSARHSAEVVSAMTEGREGTVEVAGPYLSLLATDPARTGQGLGRQLLDVAARRWPGARWLESTNPRNHSFYRRNGYRVAHEGAMGSSGVVMTQFVAGA